MVKKTWKAAEDAVAGIQITEETATIAVQREGNVNGIHVDKSGLYLRGKMSFMCMPDDMRIGGLWKPQSAWRLMLPSSTAFPNPVLTFSPNLGNVVEDVEAVAFMMGMLI